MAYSPICTLNGGASTNGLNATPAATVTIALASGPNSPIWTLTCSSTDETTDASTITSSLTINQTTKTATFTAPAAGKAMIFTSTVNNGLDPVTQRIDSTLTTTFAVYTLTGGGYRVLALNERGEGNSLFGWTSAINPIIRSTVASPGVTSISPNVGYRLGSGIPVSLVGTGFITGATVTINGIAATGVVVNSSTSISCVTGTIGGEGFGNVIVTNPGGGAGSLPNGYLALSSYMWFRGLVGDYTLDNGGAGTHIGQLTDLSGNARHLLSLGTNLGPVPTPNIFQGTKQSIGFTPNQQVVKTSFTGPSSAETFIIKKNLDPHGYLWCTGASATVDIPQGAGGNIIDDFGSTGFKSAPPNSVNFANAHLYNVQVAAGYWACSNNSLPPQYVTLTNTVGWNATLRLGTPDQTSWYLGHVAEWVTFPRVLTQSERAAVSALMTSQWI